MIPHPDFETIDMPASKVLGMFHLDMLTAADLDEDYAAVIGSAHVLRGVFGPAWPDGLTREYDETDLHWHHREFTTRRSFAWVIRSKDGAYIGCAYLNPDLTTQGKGLAVSWMIDMPDRLALLARFESLFLDWLTDMFPPDYEITSRTNAHIP